MYFKQFFSDFEQMLQQFWSWFFGDLKGSSVIFQSKFFSVLDGFRASSLAT